MLDQDPAFAARFTPIAGPLRPCRVCALPAPWLELNYGGPMHMRCAHLADQGDVAALGVAGPLSVADGEPGDAQPQSVEGPDQRVSG